MPVFTVAVTSELLFLTPRRSRLVRSGPLHDFLGRLTSWRTTVIPCAAGSSMNKGARIWPEFVLFCMYNHCYPSNRSCALILFCDCSVLFSHHRTFYIITGPTLPPIGGAPPTHQELLLEFLWRHTPLMSLRCCAPGVIWTCCRSLLSITRDLNLWGVPISFREDC